MKKKQEEQSLKRDDEVIYGVRLTDEEYTDLRMYMAQKDFGENLDHFSISYKEFMKWLNKVRP